MLTYPRVFPTTHGFGDILFTPARVQVSARTNGGLLETTERARTLWQVDMTTSVLTPHSYEELQAFFDSLRGGLNRFTMYNFIRRRPRAYPGTGWAGVTRSNGTPFDGTATLDEADGYEVTLRGLPAGYQVKTGDMMSWPWRTTRTLHRAMEPKTASSGGVVSVQVEPDIPPGTVGSPTVKLEKADAVFKLTSPNPWNAKRGPRLGAPLSFQAIQVLR